MNQATKRNLIKFLKQETATALYRVEMEERLKSEAMRVEINKRYDAFGKDLNEYATKVLKKYGLTPSNRRDKLIHIYPGSFKEFEYKCKDTEEVRIKAINDTFLKVEREVLLGTDKEAADILKAFISELKGI